MTSLKKSLFLLVPNDKSLECLEAPSSVVSHEPSVSSVSRSFSLTVSRFCSAVVLKNVDNVLCELSNLKIFFGGMRLIDANTFKATKTLELCSKTKAHGTPSNSLVCMQSPSSGSGNKNEASVIKRAKAP